MFHGRQLPQMFVLCLTVGFATGCQSQSEPTTDSSSAGPSDTATNARETPEIVETIEEFIPEPDTPFSLEPGFELLTLEDFQQFKAEPDTWTTTGDVIHCSGKPKGYIYTTETFKNFTMRLEYRFPRPPTLKSAEDAKFAGNTGFMIYIIGEHRIWPASLEVQGKHSEMATIKSNGGVPALSIRDDPAVRKAARKPVGNWNAIEITSHDGHLVALLNGTVVCISEAGELDEGAFGLQSEGFEVEFRRLCVKRD